MAGGGARSGPASTLQHPDPALCLYRTIFCVTSILISSGYDCASVPPHSIFLPIFVLTSWYRNPQRFYTREEVAKLAMAAANLLVSCPLDFKVGTFSMKYKFTILFLCGDSILDTGPASLVLNFLDPPATAIYRLQRICCRSQEMKIIIQQILNCNIIFMYVVADIEL